MNNAKLQAQKNTLVKKQLMDESDNLLDYTQGNTKERASRQNGGQWRPGWIYFTEQKIICFWGVLGYLKFPTTVFVPLANLPKCFYHLGLRSLILIRTERWLKTNLRKSAMKG